MHEKQICFIKCKGVGMELAHKAWRGVPGLCACNSPLIKIAPVQGMGMAAIICNTGFEIKVGLEYIFISSAD